jgi:hypothetical protein
MAFEFLVGNNDAKKADTIVGTDGRVVCVGPQATLLPEGLHSIFPQKALSVCSFPKSTLLDLLRPGWPPLRRDGESLNQEAPLRADTFHLI